MTPVCNGRRRTAPPNDVDNQYTWDASTTQAGNVNKAWIVRFLTPFTTVDGKVDSNYAMAVRGGW